MAAHAHAGDVTYSEQMPHVMIRVMLLDQWVSHKYRATALDGLHFSTTVWFLKYNVMHSSIKMTDYHLFIHASISPTHPSIHIINQGWDVQFVECKVGKKSEESHAVRYLKNGYRDVRFYHWLVVLASIRTARFNHEPPTFLVTGVSGEISTGVWKLGDAAQGQKQVEAG